MTTTSEARRNAARLVALALVALASGPLHAQANWPNRTIRIIAPVQPGGGVDLVARTVAEQLGSSLGQSVVVENQSGGGGIVGSNATARAAPDGYTLMVGYVGTHGTNPAVRKLPYDAIKDFTPVAMVGGTPNVFVVPPGVPAATLREFVAYAKANPDKLAYGSAGPGTLTHLAMEQFKVAAGVTDITHLAYRGIGPAFTDILGGRTQAMLPGLAAALPHIKAGKVKALAVTGTRRHPLLPDVPTFEESGYPGFDGVQWYGIVGPANLPPVIVTRLNDEINKALAKRSSRCR
jgi:tripartite-type tricarboxylate transporter receptor subunit TctC